jgi:hypothetical protein
MLGSSNPQAKLATRSGNQEPARTVTDRSP